MFDFYSMPKDLKNYLITIITLPFWYISIYYYFPSLYTNDDIILSASVCIALSTISNLLISVVIVNDHEENEGIFSFSVVITSTFFQCIWISTLIFIGYLTSRFLGYRFEYYGFLLTYFIFIFFISFLSFIIDKKGKEDNKV